MSPTYALLLYASNLNVSMELSQQQLPRSVFFYGSVIESYGCFFA